MSSKKLSEQIKSYLEANDLSVAQFARKSGLSKDNLYKWTKGAKPSDPADWDRLKKFIPEIMEGEEKNPFGTTDLSEERALIRVMLDELAHLKSKMQPGLSYEDAKEELRRKTNLVLDAMKGA